MSMLPFKDISGEVIRLNDLVIFSMYKRDSSLYLGIVSKITESRVTVKNEYGAIRRVSFPSSELLIVNGNKRLLDKAKSLGLLSNQS